MLDPAFREAVEEAGLVDALERYADAHGDKAALAQVRMWLRQRHRVGRPTKNDDKHLVEMARHLLEDPDLRARLDRGGKAGRGALNEAARRVADSDWNPKVATSKEAFVRRLVRKSSFFAFDDPKRGFDRGVWLG